MKLCHSIQLAIFTKKILTVLEVSSIYSTKFKEQGWLIKMKDEPLKIRIYYAR